MNDQEYTKYKGWRINKPYDNQWTGTLSIKDKAVVSLNCKTKEELIFKIDRFHEKD